MPVTEYNRRAFELGKSQIEKSGEIDAENNWRLSLIGLGALTLMIPFIQSLSDEALKDPKLLRWIGVLLIITVVMPIIHNAISSRYYSKIGASNLSDSNIQSWELKLVTIIQHLLFWAALSSLLIALVLFLIFVDKVIF